MCHVTRARSSTHEGHYASGLASKPLSGGRETGGGGNSTMPKNLKLWTAYTFHIPLLRATARSQGQGDESEKEWGSPSEEVPSPIFSASWSSEARKDQNTNAAGPRCITNSRRGHPRQQPAAVEMDPTNPHETASTLTTLMMETIEGLYGMGGPTATSSKTLEQILGLSQEGSILFHSCSRTRTVDRTTPTRSEQKQFAQTC